jgi:general secretion pathway protein I
MKARLQSGFTLIEVVVAFVLLSLVLATAFEVFSRGMVRAGELENQSRALVLAQSRLASAGVEDTLKEGTTSGESEDRRFHWTTAVRLHEEPAVASKPAPSSSYVMYRIEVRVTWRGDDGREHALALATMALGARA